MKTYALYCNGNLVVVKPMRSIPTCPEDFGIAYLPTSCYDIVDVQVVCALPVIVKSIPASIDVGSIGLENS